MIKKTSENKIAMPKSKLEWIELFNLADIKVKEDSTLNEILQFGAKKLKIKVKDIAISDLKKEIINIFNEKFSLQKKEDSTNEQPKETDSNESTDLNDLRKECESMGLAWGSKHTASDLRQLINAIKGVSAPLSKFTPNQQQNHLSQNSNTNKPQQTVANTTSIDQYGELFVGVVKKYFRKMTKQQILGLYTKGSYPFGYDIVVNPNNSYQVKINLIKDGKDNLYPKDGWIDTLN